MSRLASYFQFKSLTWVASAASIALGLLLMFCAACATDPYLASFSTILNILTNGQPAPLTGAQLVLLGATFIGVRAKLERMMDTIKASQPPPSPGTEVALQQTADAVKDLLAKGSKKDAKTKVPSAIVDAIGDAFSTLEGSRKR